MCLNCCHCPMALMARWEAGPRKFPRNSWARLAWPTWGEQQEMLSQTRWKVKTTSWGSLTRMYTHILTHAHTHTHMNTDTYTHTCTYTWAYTQSILGSLLRSWWYDNRQIVPVYQQLTKTHGLRLPDLKSYIQNCELNKYLYFFNVI